MSNVLVQKILNDKSYTFQLIKGEDMLGKPFYAFMLFNLGRFDEIKDSEWVDLEKEGILILKGEGHEVTEEAKQQAMYIFQSQYMKKSA